MRSRDRAVVLPARRNDTFRKARKKEDFGLQKAMDF